MLMKVLKGSAKATKKLKSLSNVLDEKGLSKYCGGRRISYGFEKLAEEEYLMSYGWYFYEALGIDACILVEYAGLNPLEVYAQIVLQELVAQLWLHDLAKMDLHLVVKMIGYAETKAATLIWDLNSRQSMGHLNEFTFDLFFFILDCIFNS
ncbi:hypothetical protein FNV43_RR02205 [Rhamnella rubrinervis]|uniref:Uncharacterized protein n=1 Tax=Rhamnella rubrinervis TaxID=2594499 RepID=A0A8K0HR21_9ROSA|nr:hypothetical protein FNV43_RR02205 [Rhamnella rubrinervis]